MSAAVAAQTVTVDGSKTHQTIDGWTNQLRVWDDPHVTDTFRPARPGEDAGRSAVDIPFAVQEEILDRLYKDLGLTHVQALLEGGAQAAKGGTWNFNWKRNDAQIAYVKQARPHGLAKWVVWTFSGESWMSITDPTERVEWLMVLLRRWRDMGVEPPYVTLIDEPSNDGIASSKDITPTYLREAVRQLGRKLHDEKFATRIVAPESLNLSDAVRFLDPIMADPETRDYVGAISTHLYGDGLNLCQLAEVRDKYAKPYGKPIWMSEFSQSSVGGPFNYALLMHGLLADYDVVNVAYEWGFFGQWERPGANLIEINYNGAPGYEYTGYTRKKAYYFFGQFSRFVGAGAKRIAALAVDPLKVSAYVNGGKLVIVALNTDHSPRPGVTFKLAGIPDLKMVSATRTSETEDWVELPALGVAAGAFVADLPPKSVTTFVGGMAASGPPMAAAQETGRRWASRRRRGSCSSLTALRSC